MFAPQVMAPRPDAAALYGGLQRSNSLTWRADAGLPPPPSEIDHYPHLDHYLSPSAELERSRSPAAMSVPYDELTQSEAMPMHAVTKHPKLKLKIVLADTVFEAGGAISGMLEVTSSTSQRLRIGEIAVELEAFEELSSRDHSATQIFLFNRTLFQGEHLPPSNAVLPSAPLQGHWTARKGRTTFPFSFRLPASVPSSLAFAGNASLRYSLKGTVQTWWNESKSLVTVRSDAFVVERWEDEFDPRYLEPVDALADTHLFMGGNGAVWLEAGVQEQLFVAGSILTIRAGVKNSSKRHMSGMKVAIARRLVFPVSGPPSKPAQRPDVGPQITDVVHTQLYKGPSYEFPPNEEVVVTLAVDIPRELRTLRKTRLFEVHIVAIVSAQMGSFAKDLAVEIPLFVAHPLSVRKFRDGPLQLLQNLPRRSQSAMAQHGQHQQVPQQPLQPHNERVLSPGEQYQYGLASPHSEQSMARLEAFAAQRGWSPAPMMAMHNGPPSRPASAAANVGQMVSLPTAPQQFWLQPANHGSGAQVMWDANGAGWSPQTLGGGNHAHAQPPPLPQRSRSAAPDVGQQSMANDLAYMALAPRHEPTAGSKHMLQQQYEQQQQQQQQKQQQQQQQQQQRRVSETVTMMNSTQPRQAAGSTPASPVLPTPPQTATYDEQVSSPPEEAQSVLYVPSPSQLLGANGQQLGLATITEDSESNAGTVRSIRTLIGSVTRGDIDQFEAIAQRAEDEVELRNAMQTVGMVPDTRQREAAQKSLPQPPSTSSSQASNTKKRVKAADLFAHVDTKPVVTETKGREEVKETVTMRNEPPKQPLDGNPKRPTSAQGQGLAALESRLNMPTPVASMSALPSGRKSEPSQRRTADSAPLLTANVAARRISSGSHTETSVIRAASAAAAEGERRAREDEEARQHDQLQRKADEERKKRRQSELLAAAAQANTDGKAKAAASSVTSSQRTTGERKEVDVTEQRKLNKEAVGRVTGWLSASPSQAPSCQDGEHASTPDSDPNMSPKTPSPSVLIEKEEVQEQRDQDDLLSPYVRSLIDNSRDLPKHKPGTSLHSHPSTRRFSGDMGGGCGGDHGKKGSAIPAKSVDAPLQPSKVINVANGELVKADDEAESQSRKTFEKKLLAPKRRTSHDNDDDETRTPSALPKYDTRSARGGRGGRVASVATMWASIADGIDGSQIKDAAPVVTLKPKAQRSGAAPALDFSERNKSGNGRVNSLSSIFKEDKSDAKKAQQPMSPLLIVNNRVKCSTDKTTGAPHFINTTVPRAVFASPASPAKVGFAATGEVPPAPRQLSMNAAATAEKSSNAASSNGQQGKLKATRKITSDLIASEARMRAGRDLAKGIDEALQAAEMGDVGLPLPMAGRGTTKPIGRDRLADLRSLWGS